MANKFMQKLHIVSRFRKVEAVVAGIEKGGGDRKRGKGGKKDDDWREKICLSSRSFNLAFYQPGYNKTSSLFIKLLNENIFSEYLPAIFCFLSLSPYIFFLSFTIYILFWLSKIIEFLCCLFLWQTNTIFVIIKSINHKYFFRNMIDHVMMMIYKKFHINILEVISQLKSQTFHIYDTNFLLISLILVLNFSLLAFFVSLFLHLFHLHHHINYFLSPWFMSDK